MSLVNDMLRDLQARQATEGMPFADLEPVRLDGESRVDTRLAFLLTSFALALLLYLVSGNLVDRSIMHASAAPDAKPEQCVAAGDEPAKPSSVLLAQAGPAKETTAPKTVVLRAAANKTPAAKTAVAKAAARKTSVSTAAAPQAPATKTPVSRTTTVSSTASSKAAPALPAETPERQARTPATNAHVAMKKRPVLVTGASVSERRLREALRRDPQDGTAWMHLYENLLDRGEVEAAEATIIEGLGSALDPSPLASRYARELIGRGALDEARTVLQGYRPASMFDQDYEALLAWLLQSTERHREAVDAYRALLAWDSKFGDWWVGLAISLENIGDRQGALRAYAQAQGSVQIKSTLAKYASQRIAALNADG